MVYISTLFFRYECLGFFAVLCGKEIQNFFLKLHLFLLLNKICISVKLLLISYILRSDDYRNTIQHHFQHCLLTQLSRLSAPVFMQCRPPHSLNSSLTHSSFWFYRWFHVLVVLCRQALAF